MSATATATAAAATAHGTENVAGEHVASAPVASGHAPSAHGAHGGGGAHGGAAGAHGGRKHRAHDHPPGTPPWLISFGDMMTLFLCFFIMLVTMAKSQDAGLVAGGLGPFVAALENHGMDAPLMGAESMYAVNTYRERFGLKPITSAEQLIGATEVKSAAHVEQLVKAALRPYVELRQPLVATFAAGSAELTDAGRRYLDLLAETLRPGRGQILVLEGHADATSTGDAAALLAAARAGSVRSHLLDEHGLIPTRVEARAFAVEPRGAATGGVDARLIQPSEKDEG